MKLYDYPVKKQIVVVVFISVLLGIIQNKFNIFIVSKLKAENTQFDFLTVSSIFCGFALTNLGIIISISNEEIIKKLRNTNLLEIRNRIIKLSIAFSACSMVVSIIYICGVYEGLLGAVNAISEQIEYFYLYLDNMICIFGIISFLVSVFYFIWSLIKMIDLIDSVYKSKNRYNKEQIERIKSQGREIYNEDENL